MFGQLSPDAAVILLTVGIALIYYELNRPGSILPGAAGLLIVLLGFAAISRYEVNVVALTLILSAVALLTLSLLRPTSVLISIVPATIALILGLRWLPARSCCAVIHNPVAAGCGLALGAGTSLLTRIARRARVETRV